MSKLISYTYQGNYSKTEGFLKDLIEIANSYKIRALLEEYGAKIVSALQSGTPKRTGATAGSWYYEITTAENNSIALEIHNGNMGSDGKTPVAILIQMGHGTRTGGYVPPIDYINPVVEPLFAELTEKLSEAVKS